MPPLPPRLGSDDEREDVVFMRVVVFVGCFFLSESRRKFEGAGAFVSTKLKIRLKMAAES